MVTGANSRASSCSISFSRLPHEFPQFRNGLVSALFGPFNGRTREQERGFGHDAPLSAMIAKQNPAPKDSQDGHHGIEMRTSGCKLPAKKNEGMAERDCSNERYQSFAPPKQGRSMLLSWSAREFARITLLRRKPLKSHKTAKGILNKT
jgi:hypothetical protein